MRKLRAIEALGTIEPTGPIERALARLLLAGYKRRLRAISFSVQSASGLPAGGSSAAPLGGMPVTRAEAAQENE